MIRTLALLAMLLAAAPATAQPSPEMAQALARIGRVVAPPPTFALYAPLHAAALPSGVRVTRDVAYGPDPRHRLDVLAPEGEAAPRRVLVFVHGGGFTGGNKQVAGYPAFYDHIALWAVRQGHVGVNITYRLAPAHPYPAAQEDIAAALSWVAREIGGHGGDAAQVFLMGHSAGAVHAALYAAEPRFHPPGIAPPRGYALVSALYAFGAGAGDASGEFAYFGPDEAVRTSRSLVPTLVRTEAPLLIAFAELNPTRFNDQAEAMVRALRAAGRQPVVLPLTGHSHMSEILAIGTDDVSLTGPLAAFLRR
jgi:triacylglycerol lipase